MRLLAIGCSIAVGEHVSVLLVVVAAFVEVSLAAPVRVLWIG